MHTKVMLASITAAPRATGNCRAAKPICQSSETMSVLQGQHKPHHFKHSGQRSLLNSISLLSLQEGVHLTAHPLDAKNMPRTDPNQDDKLLTTSVTVNPSRDITNYTES